MGVFFLKVHTEKRPPLNTNTLPHSPWQWQWGQERKALYPEAPPSAPLLHSPPPNCGLPGAERKPDGLCTSASELPTRPSLPQWFHFLLTYPGQEYLRAPPAFAMADTYAVVQKPRATSGPRSGSGLCSTERAPLYSPVTPGARWPQAPVEETQEALLGGVPADPSPTGPGAYEDVTGGSQTGGLGFNLRIGRPKGPRDPPAEWTRV